MTSSNSCGTGAMSVSNMVIFPSLPAHFERIDIVARPHLRVVVTCRPEDCGIWQHLKLEAKCVAQLQQNCYWSSEWTTKTQIIKDLILFPAKQWHKGTIPYFDYILLYRYRTHEGWNLRHEKVVTSQLWHYFTLSRDHNVLMWCHIQVQHGQRE